MECYVPQTTQTPWLQDVLSGHDSLVSPGQKLEPITKPKLKSKVKFLPTLYQECQIKIDFQ